MSKSIMRRLAIQKGIKSKCCNAPVEVKTSWYIYPNILNNDYYICTKCREPVGLNPTDVKEEKYNVD